MIVSGPSPLIWPLLDRLNPTVAAQRSPTSASTQRLTSLPVAPWDSQSPLGQSGFGNVASDPKIWDFASWKFGLSALQVQPIEIKLLKTNPRAARISEQARLPAVVRSLGLCRDWPLPTPPDRNSDYRKSNRIIWPLLDKLNPTIAAQRRPKTSPHLGLVRIPTLPWGSTCRPGQPGYGRFESDPKIWDFAPWKFGLSALQVQPIEIKLLKTNPRASPFAEQAHSPGAVHSLLPPKTIYRIFGVTRDQYGNILGGCIVELYQTQNAVALASTTSDAVTGAFNFNYALAPPWTHFLTAYLPGGQDVAGTTVNTLTGT